MSRGRTVEAYVEVDIDEFDDEVLIAEMRDREIALHDKVSVEDMYLALKFGRDEEALRLLRIYIMDITGRVL